MASWTVLNGFSPSGPFLSLAVTILVFAGLWRLSVARRDCGVVDLYWSFGFAVVGWIQFAISGRADAPRLLLLGLITLWATRLGLHLIARHRSATAEDARYAAMRQRNGANWPARSFWMVFMLQAIVLWFIATPVHLAFSGPAIESDPLVLAIGTAIFAVGFLIEAVADAALTTFRKDPANRGRLLTTGIFAWSRHPNYFGEAMLWWGLGIFAYGLSGSPIALLGPAILNLLLVRVSGVPILDEHLSTRPGFDEYVARTSPFIPRPPLPSAQIERKAP